MAAGNGLGSGVRCRVMFGWKGVRMTDGGMKRASQADMRRMKETRDLQNGPAAPEGEDLGPEFWAKAQIEGPRRVRSVHLKLDPEVFEYFVQVTGGKGHLTRMQAVLKAYVEAHRRG